MNVHQNNCHVVQDGYGICRCHPKPTWEVALERYDLKDVIRMGEAWREMTLSVDGAWVKYEEVARIVQAQRNASADVMDQLAQSEQKLSTYKNQSGRDECWKVEHMHLTDQLAAMTQERNKYLVEREQALAWRRADEEMIKGQTEQVNSQEADVKACHITIENLTVRINDLLAQLDAQSMTYQDNLTEIQFLKNDLANKHRMLIAREKECDVLMAQRNLSEEQRERAEAEIERITTEPRAVQLLNANHRLEEELTEVRAELIQAEKNLFLVDEERTHLAKEKEKFERLLTTEK